MQLSLPVLSALLLCLLGCNRVAAAGAASGNETPTTNVCLRACVTSSTQSCESYRNMKEIWRGPVTLHRVQSLDRRVTYGKKTAWWRQTAAGNWFGAHVLQDGSMSMWNRGTSAKGKMYAYGFHLIDNANVQQTHYYWLRGLDTCRGEKGSFVEYGSLKSVSIAEVSVTDL